MASRPSRRILAPAAGPGFPDFYTEALSCTHISAPSSQVWRTGLRALASPVPAPAGSGGRDRATVGRQRQAQTANLGKARTVNEDGVLPEGQATPQRLNGP